MTSAFQERSPDVGLCQLKAVSSVSFFVPSNYKTFKPTLNNNKNLVDGSPSAALLSTTDDDDDVGDGTRVSTVIPGETYALKLDNFPNQRFLSLRLVPPEGQRISLGTIKPQPDSQEKTKTWNWEVPSNLKPGDYYIEAIAGKQAIVNDVFAYSQAFEVEKVLI